MKVAVICREHPEHYEGGFSIAAWNTARAAADAGFEVTYITAERPDGFADAEVRNGVKIIWMKGTHHQQYPGFHRVLAASFPTYHKQHGFDLIHGHGYSAAPLAKDEALRAGLPIIFHDHGSKASYVQSVINHAVLNNTLPYPPQLEEYIHHTYFSPSGQTGESDFKHMRRYDKVLATSTISMWDFITRYMLTNVEPFSHCIYGLDDVVPKRQVLPEGPKDRIRIVLFAGQLGSPWKVHVPAVMKLLPMKDKITLVLIGPGGNELCSQLLELYKEHTLCNSPRPEKEVLAELASCNILFECSIHHMGCNLTGISALGLGVPILTFPNGGHFDMVSDERGFGAGILIDPVRDDPCDAVEEIVKYWDGYSRNAKALFHERFSPEAASKRIKEIYESAVA